MVERLQNINKQLAVQSFASDIKCHTLPSISTAAIAACCSIILSSMPNVLPQHFVHSCINWRWGNLSISCFCHSLYVSLIDFRKCSTSFLHRPRTLCTLVTSSPFLINNCSVCYTREVSNFQQANCIDNISAIVSCSSTYLLWNFPVVKQGGKHFFNGAGIVILRDLKCLETSRLHLELTVYEMHGKQGIRVMLMLWGQQICGHCAILNCSQLLLHNCSNLKVLIWKSHLCKVHTMRSWNLDSAISSKCRKLDSSTILIGCKLWQMNPIVAFTSCLCLQLSQGYGADFAIAPLSVTCFSFVASLLDPAFLSLSLGPWSANSSLWSRWCSRWRWCYRLEIFPEYATTTLHSWQTIFF